MEWLNEIFCNYIKYDEHSKTEYIDVFSLPSRSAGVRAMLRVTSNSKLILLHKSIILEPSPSQRMTNKMLFDSFIYQKTISQYDARLYMLNKDVPMSTFNAAICFCIGYNAPGNIIHWTVENSPTKIRYKNLKWNERIQQLLQHPHVPKLYYDYLLLLWNSPFFKYCKQLLTHFGLLPTALCQRMNSKRINAKKEQYITLEQIQSVNNLQESNSVNQIEYSKEEIIAFGLYKIICNNTASCLLEFVHSICQILLNSTNSASTHHCIIL